jgi:predicted O-methyltransferase YrrM
MSEFPNWFDVTAKENFEEYTPNTPKLDVLQIGTFTGDATEWLLANRDIEHITDVDTWQGSDEDAHDKLNFSKVEQYYDKRFKGNPKIDKYKMTSTEFLSNYSEKYDFIYIDGDHTAVQVGIDGLLAWQSLKSGGVIAFDDYTWESGKGEYYDPRLAIDSVYHIVKTQVDVLVTNSQLWLRRK